MAAPDPQAAVAAPPETVVVTLRVPGLDPAGPGPVPAEVEPGGQVVLHALVRNQSGIVDNYQLKLKGLPPDWWTITPGTVYLVPFGSAEQGYEQEVEVRIHPPRTWEAEARPWPIKVVAVSSAKRVEAGSARADVTIGPFHALESELRPEHAAGRRKADYALAVRNLGNAPAQVGLAGTDQESALRFHFARPQLELLPGQRSGTQFAIRPPKQLIVGRPKERRFTVAVEGAAAGSPPLAGVYRQRAWLPRSVLAIIPIVAAAGIFAWLQRPNTTTVPDLTQAASVFEVQTLLQEADLELGEATEEQVAGVRPGTILAQTPDVGEKVEKGTTVVIQVAVGTGKVEVPRIAGLTLLAADARLRKVGLQLGQARPEATDPEQDEIASQIPAPATVVEQGSAVDVFFRPPAEAAGTGATTGSEPGTGDGAGPSVKVPAVTTLALAGAAAAISKAGFVPVEVRRFDANVAAGKLVEQIPAGGAAVQQGGKVQLVVSAGYPRIAFDRGGDLWVAGGARGKPVRPLAKSGDVEEHPAWSADGTLIAYRRGPTGGVQGRIWLVTPGKPDSARPLTSEGFADRRPAFSPNGKVVAFVRGQSDGTRYDLCFQAIAGGEPSCIEDAERDVSRPAWSPDGRAILVQATDAADAQAELLLYTSSSPSSPRAADWVSQGLVSDSLHGKRAGDEVAQAAWRPDGKQVAFTANWNAAFFRLFLVPYADGVLGKPKPVPAIRGCEVAWRPDGGELALTREDKQCRESGEVFRVDPARPAEQISLTQVGASNPIWEPLSVGG